MNYELAKKLKNAGFPQNARMGAFISDNDGENGDCYGPTLSELIHECGEGFEMLERDGKWWAWEYSGVDGGGGKSGSGQTPEEAVANLWLKLNER